MAESFGRDARDAVYRVIEGRRDVRSFRTEPVPDDVLWRMLEAARFDGERQRLYRSLKLEGIMDPPVNLCVGYPREFLDEPELQRRGWAQRLPREALVYDERWGASPAADAA